MTDFLILVYGEALNSAKREPSFRLSPATTNPVGDLNRQPANTVPCILDNDDRPSRELDMTFRNYSRQTRGYGGWSLVLQAEYNDAWQSVAACGKEVTEVKIEG
jgi:hypothetical protein